MLIEDKWKVEEGMGEKRTGQQRIFYQQTDQDFKSLQINRGQVNSEQVNSGQINSKMDNELWEWLTDIIKTDRLTVDSRQWTG